MSRISQELAGKVAAKLTEKSRIALEKLKDDYSNVAHQAYISQTPKELLDAFKKYPNWLYTRRVVEFSGHGFRWESVSIKEPVICNSNQSCVLELDEKLADILMKSKRKWEKAKEEYEKLKSETTEALLALRTYNNIREHIPAAEQFLPPPVSNALVVNFTDLNKKLEKQPKTTIEKVLTNP